MIFIAGVGFGLAVAFSRQIPSNQLDARLSCQECSPCPTLPSYSGEAAQMVSSSLSAIQKAYESELYCQKSLVECDAALSRCRSEW